MYFETLLAQEHCLCILNELEFLSDADRLKYKYRSVKNLN